MPRNFLTVIDQPDPPKYQAGDEVEFIKADGTRWWLLLLGHKDRIPAEWDVIWYDGNPHLTTISEQRLSELRVLSVSRRLADDLDMLREQVGLKAAA